jgi:hypothetical protein
MDGRMKRSFAVSTLIALVSLSVFSFGVAECLDSYFAGLQKCLQTFDIQKRHSCFWGEAETLKASLESVAGDKQSSFYGAKIVEVAFFRNENTTVTSCEPFSVEVTGMYTFTVVSGSPLDKKRSKPKTFAISVSEGKKSVPVIKFSESNQEMSKEIELKKGKKYLIVADELTPAASYITVIVSDKEISLK